MRRPHPGCPAEVHLPCQTGRIGTNGFAQPNSRISLRATEACPAYNPRKMQRRFAKSGSRRPAGSNRRVACLRQAGEVLRDGDCRTAFLSQAGMLRTASPNLVQQCPHCSAACVGRVPRFFRRRGLLLEPLSKLTDVMAGSHGRAQKIEHFQATVLIHQAQRRGGVFAVERNFEHTIDPAGVDPALDMMQRRPNRNMAFDQGNHVIANPTDDRQGGVDVERQSHPFER